MSIHRRAAQQDGNSEQIDGALRSAGAYVWLVSGRDIPDRIVAFQGRLILMEYKNANGAHGAGLSDGQKSFRDKLIAQGCGDNHAEVWNPTEALAAIGVTVAPIVTIASAIIKFPYICVKLSNGATYRRHLLDLPKLAHASEQERKKRFVYGDRIEWIMLDYALTVEEVKKW